MSSEANVQLLKEAYRRVERQQGRQRRLLVRQRHRPADQRSTRFRRGCGGGICQGYDARARCAAVATGGWPNASCKTHDEGIRRAGRCRCRTRLMRLDQQEDPEGRRIQQGGFPCSKGQGIEFYEYFDTAHVIGACYPDGCNLARRRPFGRGERHGRCRRTFRRADRRRRPVRHRRGLSPAGASARTAATSILEGRDGIGGTWDLFRYPGIRSDSRHVHARLSLQAVDRAEGDRRRPVDPATMCARPPPRTASTGTSASATASSARPGRRADARWTVEAERGAEAHEPCASPAISCSCAPAITTTRRATRRSSQGAADFAGPHRPSADLARGPRLRRQARRRDRQRRDRGDAGAGDGEDGGARHDAAALADLCRVAPGARTRSPTGCARNLPARLAYRHHRAGRTCCSACSSSSSAGASPAKVKELIARAACSMRSAPTTTSRRTSRRATIPGTSGCAWCPTATCSRRSASSAPRSSPTRSTPSPTTASA